MSGSSTAAIHADRDVYPSRAVARPIYQTAAFWAEDAEQFARAAVEPRGHDFYTRYGNPNHAQVAAVIAELEHTEAAMVTASGMAALTTAVLGLVSAGDHVIGQRSTYGGTASVLLNLLPRLGVTTTQVDQTDPGAFERAVTPRTRLILVESPSNPLLQITDLRSIAAMARAHGVLTLADNTFATPLNQRPIDFGIDLVWHSATKYLNGHSDVSAGALAGPAQLLDRIWEVAVLTGGALGPFDAWLLLRGIRTLPLRMTRHDSTRWPSSSTPRISKTRTCSVSPGGRIYPRRPSSCRRPRAGATTVCGYSPLPANCPSPATRRSAPHTPGWDGAARRRNRAASSRSAMQAWAGPSSGWPPRVRYWNCSRICHGSPPRWSARSAPIRTETSTHSNCARSHPASVSPRIRSAAV